MKVDCKDLERIFRDGSEEEWAELERHAGTCAACAEEIRAWKALSVAAGELRDNRQDPALWTRIERSLIEQRAKALVRPRVSDKLALWRGVSLGWQTALAGTLVLLLALAGGYVIRRGDGGDRTGAQLLKNSTLVEVERTEREYMRAIDKLATEAKPQLDSPSSPLMASYREKLMVIDGAISELRAEAGQNPSNAHLRYQLLAMYQEKQQTLEEVLETKQ